jgi:hypothetical protein
LLYFAILINIYKIGIVGRRDARAVDAMRITRDRLTSKRLLVLSRSNKKRN